MDRTDLERTEDPGVAETPEDVAILYSWANLHGAKYRDFSASRRESRAHMRHRAAEQQREEELRAQAEAEAAAAAAEQAARDADEAARTLAQQARFAAQQEAFESHEQERLHRQSLQAAEEASRKANAERVEAARRAEAAAAAAAAADRAGREIAEARASAERQAANYADYEFRRRQAAGPQPRAANAFNRDALLNRGTDLDRPAASRAGKAYLPSGVNRLRNDYSVLSGRSEESSAYDERTWRLPETEQSGRLRESSTAKEGRLSASAHNAPEEFRSRVLSDAQTLPPTDRQMAARPQGYRPDDPSGITKAYRTPGTQPERRERDNLAETGAFSVDFEPESYDLALAESFSGVTPATPYGDHEVASPEVEYRSPYRSRPVAPSSDASYKETREGASPRDPARSQDGSRLTQGENDFMRSRDQVEEWDQERPTLRSMERTSIEREGMEPNVTKLNSSERSFDARKSEYSRSVYSGSEPPSRALNPNLAEITRSAFAEYDMLSHLPRSETRVPVRSVARRSHEESGAFSMPQWRGASGEPESSEPAARKTKLNPERNRRDASSASTEMNPVSRVNSSREWSDEEFSRGQRGRERARNNESLTSSDKELDGDARAGLLSGSRREPRPLPANSIPEPAEQSAQGSPPAPRQGGGLGSDRFTGKRNVLPPIDRREDERAPSRPGGAGPDRSRPDRSYTALPSEFADTEPLDRESLTPAWLSAPRPLAPEISGIVRTATDSGDPEGRIPRADFRRAETRSTQSPPGEARPAAPNPRPSQPDPRRGQPDPSPAPPAPRSASPDPQSIPDAPRQGDRKEAPEVEALRAQQVNTTPRVQSPVAGSVEARREIQVNPGAPPLSNAGAAAPTRMVPKPDVQPTAGARPAQEPSRVTDTLQHSRERVASKWFALRGVFDQEETVKGETTPPRPDPGADGSQRTPLLAVYSLAGGVGKTCLVATLGRALSSIGERVLLADTTSHGLLPFYFGASELRAGVVRTFSPPSGSTDAPIYLVSYDVDPIAQKGSDPAAMAEAQSHLIEEIVRAGVGKQRILLDLNWSANWMIRRLARRNATILVPLAPDMNSIISLQAVEKHFKGVLDADGRAVFPFFVLNQFDSSQPLHLDVREVLRQQLGDRLLPFVIRRSPAVSEALAEGMTVIDYAPEIPVSLDYRGAAAWLRSLNMPVPSGLRNARWSER